MKIEVRNRCSDYDSYRAARVKSLFNVEAGCNFSLDADLAIDDQDWKVGVVVGPSGSGKSSIGRGLFGGGAMYQGEWPKDTPLIDAIMPEGGIDQVTAALAAVGLGSVPAWLRPYEVLSMGERFRADLARVICEAPRQVVIDEFTSVVDRQIAKIGALAFQKAWRRTGGQCVLLTCHYDVLDWLDPDWVFDTQSGRFARGCLRRRPKLELEVRETNWSWWPLFEPHHYLKLPHMPCATCYVGLIDGEAVVHLAMSQLWCGREVQARACRLVVMPEWQGAGVGLRFLNFLCEQNLRGEGRLGRPVPTMFHTSHPGLAAALRRSKGWNQVTAKLHGENRGKCMESVARTGGNVGTLENITGAGYGGHFRAVQGFRYVGAS